FKLLCCQLVPSHLIEAAAKNDTDALGQFRRTGRALKVRNRLIILAIIKECLTKGIALIHVGRSFFNLTLVFLKVENTLLCKVFLTLRKPSRRLFGLFLSLLLAAFDHVVEVRI